MKWLMLAALILASCGNGAATETTQTQNKDFRVDFLFENDGCRIYRFYDGGIARYYVRCGTGIGAASTFWTRTVTTCNGKYCYNTSHDEQVAAAAR